MGAYVSLKILYNSHSWLELWLEVVITLKHEILNL